MSQLITQESLTVSDAQKNAWVMLAGKKNTVAANLQKRELEMQGVIANPENLAEAMAKYRKLHDELVAERTGFTNIIRDKLITPMMETEKRTDPKINANYLALAQRELDLRKQETVKLQQEQNVATEKAQFKAHFQNEYMAIAAEYRHVLKGIIHQCYQSCLGAQTPPDSVASAITIAEAALTDVKTRQPNKFTRVHLTPEDAAALYKQLPPFNKAQILEDAKMELKEKFSMYANDLANAAAAIENEAREFQATIVEEAQELKTEQAANVLMANAEAFVLPEAGFKAVVEQKKIVIEDNSEAWVVKIMGAFMANFQAAFAKTRNKKYSSLTVAQMAAALDAAGVRVEGVQYQTIEK